MENGQKCAYFYLEFTAFKYFSSFKICLRATRNNLKTPLDIFFVDLLHTFYLIIMRYSLTLFSLLVFIYFYFFYRISSSTYFNSACNFSNSKTYISIISTTSTTTTNEIYCRNITNRNMVMNRNFLSTKI